MTSIDHFLSECIWLSSVLMLPMMIVIVSICQSTHQESIIDAHWGYQCQRLWEAAIYLNVHIQSSVVLNLLFKGMMSAKWGLQYIIKPRIITNGVYCSSNWFVDGFGDGRTKWKKTNLVSMCGLVGEVRAYTSRPVVGCYGCLLQPNVIEI